MTEKAPIRQQIKAIVEMVTFVPTLVVMGVEAIRIENRSNRKDQLHVRTQSRGFHNKRATYDNKTGIGYVPTGAWVTVQGPANNESVKDYRPRTNKDNEKEYLPSAEVKSKDGAVTTLTPEDPSAEIGDVLYTYENVS